MKQQVTVDKSCCDLCNSSEHCWRQCQHCKKDVCWNCIEKGKAKEYRCSVFFSSTNDDVYCKECDDKLTKSGKNKLHKAYRRIESLREEYSTFSNAFKKKEKEAESKVEELRESS